MTVTINVAHLEMIQQKISRFGGNCFSLKALAVTISGAVIAFGGNENPPIYVACLLAAGIMGILWFMDSQYVGLARAHSQLYDAARMNRVEAYCMDARPFHPTKSEFISIMFSWSVLPFYSSLIVLLAALSAWS